MISVRQAQSKLISTVRKSAIQEIPLSAALNHVLGITILSPMDSPKFDNSAMDGWALVHDDLVELKPIRVIGTIAAGEVYRKTLKRGQALRIFTGAAVPKGADVVLNRERAREVQGMLVVHDDLISMGTHIRLRASELKEGKAALRKGAVLNPAAIGFLAGLGITKLFAHDRAKISILITGNELQLPGKKLKGAQIYESNSHCLRAALQSCGYPDVPVFYAKDEPKEIERAFREASRKADMVLVTGGVSVGDYDFSVNVFEKLGVRTVFHKVAQKPGKPLFFGTLNSKYVFGLPGNPASVLTCFYQYVLPALKKFAGYKDCFLPKRRMMTADDLNKSNRLTHFMKAHTDMNVVKLLPGQSSSMMQTFAEANCFIVMRENDRFIPEGDLVEVHFLWT